MVADLYASWTLTLCCFHGKLVLCVSALHGFWTISARISELCQFHTKCQDSPGSAQWRERGTHIMIYVLLRSHIVSFRPDNTCRARLVNVRSISSSFTFHSNALLGTTTCSLQLILHVVFYPSRCVKGTLTSALYCCLEAVSFRCASFNSISIHRILQS